MSNFEFKKCGNIEGLYEVVAKVYRDSRGFNMENYNEKVFFDTGLTMRFVQDNYSVSSKYVLRGLHFQRKYQQGKLVRVIQGEVYDVVVDLREGSKTYGEWYGTILSSDMNNMLYVPEGFAHGFLVLSEMAAFSYKLTDFYHPEDEGGILWNDKRLGIEWPVSDYSLIITSERDNNHPCLEEILPLGKKVMMNSAI